MIACERDLENYICEHQDQFISVLKKIYCDKDVKFIGRQVKIGTDNICDLLYYWEVANEKEAYKCMEYLIVELKYRQLEPKDLSQLLRYKSLLQEKLYNDENYKKVDSYVRGLFVSFGANKEMQEIIISGVEDIEYIAINPKIEFVYDGGWEHAEEYVNALELDARVDKLYREEK